MGEVRESYLGVSELDRVKVNDTDLAEISTLNFDVQMKLVFEKFSEKLDSSFINMT